MYFYTKLFFFVIKSITFGAFRNTFSPPNMKNLYAILFFAVCALYVNTGKAATYTWAATSEDSYSNSSAWDLNNGSVPGTGDVVIFNGTASGDCIIDQDVEVTSITINGYSGTIKFGDAFAVTTTGVFTISSGTFDGDGQLSGFSEGLDLTVGGVCTINGTSTFITPGGFFTLNGNLTTGGTPTFTANVGTTTFLMLSATKTVQGGFTYNNLEIATEQASGSARSLALASAITVKSDLTITSTSTRGVNINTSAINLRGNLIATGYSATTFASSQSGSIILNGTSAQSIMGPISGGQFPAITINQSSTGGVSLSGAINVAGSFTYTSSGTGSVSPGASTVTILGSTAKTSFDCESTGGTRMPFNNLVLSGGAVTLSGGLRVDGALTLNTTLTTSGNTLELRGDFTNGGTFTPSSSTILLQGNNSQSLDFSNGAANTIARITCSKTGNTATITDAINLSTLLTVTGGTFNANGNITMLSTGPAASATAEVAAVTGGSITGQVTVQRHIPSWGRRFRFLASPVSGVSFSNSWQQSTHITGPGGAGNGFDATAGNSASCYTYVESTAGSNSLGWTSLSNTNSTNLTPGVGYRMFIRGSRTAGKLDGSDNTQDAITLSATGTLAVNQSTITLGCSNGCGSSDDGWHLVGNPYQATINWNSGTITKTNVANAVYVFRPETNTYAEYVSGAGTNGGSNFISPGQAMFIRSTSASSSINFPEGCKSAFSTPTNLFKTESITNQLRVKLSDQTQTTTTSDIVLRYLDSASASFDNNYDAYRMTYNANGNLSSHNGGSDFYAINTHNKADLNANDTFKLGVTLPATAASYKMSFEDVASFDPALNIYLKDNFSNTYVDLKQNSSYVFSVSSNPLTKGNDRFNILFGSGPSLPVKLINFTAVKAGENVNLAWNTQTEVNSKLFLIERSNDGRAFEQIGVIAAKGKSTTTVKYNYADNYPVANADNYYRLKMVDQDGSFEYSSIQIVGFSKSDKVNAGNNELSLSLYPVPAKSNLNIEGLEGQHCEVAISGVYGEQVASQHLAIESGKAVLDIENLKPGIYVIEVTNDNGAVSKHKFIKE